MDRTGGIIYGSLQGLNKAETAEKYGDEQVNIWRRSFDATPRALVMYLEQLKQAFTKFCK